jgi:DNA-binding transcriptional ArsR family regulator
MNPLSEADGEAAAMATLAALAQGTRLRIFRLLVGAAPGGLHPGRIAEALALSANLLSFHLKELQHCGLIAATREGKFMRYRADLKAMRGLVDFLTAHCCEGRPCPGVPVVDCSSADLPPSPGPAIAHSPGRARMAGHLQRKS